jgi:hypothetical protein
MLIDNTSDNNLTSWEVENARVTAFYKGSVTIQDWWNELLDQQPEVERKNNKTGETEYVGTIDDNQLVMRIRPERIDWFVKPDNIFEEINRPHSIGVFPEPLSSFIDITSRWLKLETLPLINRLAFALTLSFSVDDLQQGQKEIQKYLHNIRLEADIEELLFQVNRPRVSKIQELRDLKINRLSKWSLAKWIMSYLTADGQTIKMQSGNLIRLELDINSSSEYTGDFDSKILAVLLDELKNFSFEIVKKGDVP